MTRVALFSREPARGWLPWAWLAPILLVLFNAVPVVAMDGWMQARGWSTPGGDPVGLAGLHALLWIGFAPTLLLVLAWVRGVERRSLASIGLTGAAPLRTFLRGLATKRGQVHLSVADDLAGRCARLTLANRWVLASAKRGQVHLSIADDLAGRCAGLTLANRWVLASTIARKSSRPYARCCWR